LTAELLVVSVSPEEPAEPGDGEKRVRGFKMPVRFLLGAVVLL
jgi:hypothetical protein